MTFLVIFADFFMRKNTFLDRFLDDFHGYLSSILTIYFNYAKGPIFQFLKKTVVWKSVVRKSLCPVSWIDETKGKLKETNPNPNCNPKDT